MNCNVFKGEKLCYLFVGRAAYKVKDTENPSPWQLPSVFVMRFAAPPPVKRIYPFDSGAFARHRFPDYITTFEMTNFELGPDQDQIGRLISLYFESPKRYIERKAVDQEKLTEEHVLSMSHAEILALGRLYREGSANKYDDRAAALEIQINEDIPLTKANLLGVVVPDEYLRTAGVKESLSSLTNIIEGYQLFPLSVSQHYALIYECVQRIYRKAGISI
jgi:hypothetical protein